MCFLFQESFSHMRMHECIWIPLLHTSDRGYMFCPGRDDIGSICTMYRRVHVINDIPDSRSMKTEGSRPKVPRPGQLTTVCVVRYLILSTFPEPFLGLSSHSSNENQRWEKERRPRRLHIQFSSRCTTTITTAATTQARVIPLEISLLFLCVR